MKSRYQKAAAKAAVEFQDWARESNQPIQLTFPITEMIELIKQGLGDLVRHLGKLFIEEVLETEANQIGGCPELR